MAGGQEAAEQAKKEQAKKEQVKNAIRRLTAIGCLANYIDEVLWVVYPKGVLDLVEAIETENPALMFRKTVQKNLGLGNVEPDNKEKAAGRTTPPVIPASDAAPAEAPGDSANPPTTLRLPGLPPAISVRGDLGSKGGKDDG